MKMNSNIYKNEIIDDDNDDNDRQHFCRIPTDWFSKTQQSIKPKLYEQTVTTTTTTTINKEKNSMTDKMTTTHLEKSPIRRVNLVSGPQSAFARLFPNKYRHEQEEVVRKQRPTSLSDNQYYNFDRLKTSDDADHEDTRKSRRVSFYDQYLSDQIDPNTQIKSDRYLQKDLTHIPLNYDPDPEIIYRDNPNKVVYVQKVGVRYLKPPTPPPPEPIIIRERHATPPQEPPPMIISTTPPITPRTPSPLIVREQPPTPPQHYPTKIITKTLPAPPMSSRRVIIKRMPPLPAKPRPVIIEKWLPYKTPAVRPILYERAEPSEQIRSTQRNVILQYEPARVRVEQEIQNAGYFRVDPERYRAQFGSELRRTDSIRRVLQDIGCNPDCIASTGYNTSSSSSNPTNNSSHYDYPRKMTTCFTDEQLSELIDKPTVSQDKNQVYYTTNILPNS